MTQEEKGRLLFEINEMVMERCDEPIDAYTVIISLVLSFSASLFKEQDDRLASMEYMQRKIGEYIENVKKGEFILP